MIAELIFSLLPKRSPKDPQLAGAVAVNQDGEIVPLNQRVFEIHRERAISWALYEKNCARQGEKAIRWQWERLEYEAFTEGPDGCA